MAQALHNGFDRADRLTPYPFTPESIPSFAGQAPALLDIDALITAFGQALAREGATGHRLHLIDGDGEGRNMLLTCHGPTDGGTAGDEGATVFRIATPDDDAMLRLAIDSPEPPDRPRRARLHALAVIHATHALTLIEATEEAGPDSAAAAALTPLECQCLQLLLAGLSGLDMGDQLGLSPPAVGIFLRRATARLGASSAVEACGIALARGLLDPAIS